MGDQGVERIVLGLVIFSSLYLYYNILVLRSAKIAISSPALELEVSKSIELSPSEVILPTNLNISETVFSVLGVQSWVLLFFCFVSLLFVWCKKRVKVVVLEETIARKAAAEIGLVVEGREIFIVAIQDAFRWWRLGKGFKLKIQGPPKRRL